MTLPHNEQKYKNKPLSLQHLGNLAYHQGKSATSYGSVNSLTPHNNHYTLLYPDLVQELFGFALHNSNSTKNNLHFFGSLGVSNTKSSSIDPSLSASLGSTYSSLSPRDILFFLQIVSLYQLELSKGNSSITYPSLKLAKLLGVDVSCDSNDFGSDSSTSIASNMRSTVLKMTAKLESLGLLKVFRRKRKNGMDMANKLVPFLPDRLHARIKDSPSNLKVSDSSKLDHESNLEHILRTKLFVPIELEFMKNLFKDKMPSKYKLFFLNCIMSAYRHFRQNSSSLSFAATSLELMKQNNISRRSLFNIFKYIKQQDSNFFIKVEHKYTKSDDIDSNRYDKSIFVISINPLVFPNSYIKHFEEQEEISNINHDELPSINSSTFPDTYAGFETGVQKKQPSSAKKTALNNKEEIIKNKYNRNIDYIDASCENLENSSVSCSSSSSSSIPITTNIAINHKEEFFEDKQNLSSSESYNNSSFLNDTDSRNSGNISEEVERWQELRHFYPLSEQDVDTLNFRAGREFSNNFMNQLLLKLYIKYPEKRFKNKFTFLSYMAKILKNEKHQGPLVNHTSFRFTCNIGTIEKNLLEYEKYLNQIEDSLDLSKEMQLKKKIAGRFSTEVAYKILKKVQFKKNHDNSFITALIPYHLVLSERKIETLSEQLEAVYGINGYYVQEVVAEVEERVGDRDEMLIPPPRSKTRDIDHKGKPIDILETGSKLNTTNENTAWHQIRKGLIEELGEEIDTVWFSKAVAKECRETGLLTLTMPTRFMSDWVRNNYSHVIRRLSERCGVKMVEYCWNANI